MKNREIVAAVTAELERIGATEIEYRHEGRGGHPRIWFTLRGRRLYKAVPCSSGDRKAQHRAIVDVRTITGMRPERQAPRERRRGRKEAASAPAPECPSITVKPDPWAALAALKGGGQSE